jgi:hypothetical protein
MPTEVRLKNIGQLNSHSEKTKISVQETLQVTQMNTGKYDSCLCEENKCTELMQDSDMIMKTVLRGHNSHLHSKKCTPVAIKKCKSKTLQVLNVGERQKEEETGHVHTL